jgi:hypothetical protein
MRRDETSDIAAAMAAVEQAMKKKNMAHENGDLQSSIAEAERRMNAEAREAEAREEQKQARKELEQERMIARLRAAMKKGNLKALGKAIDNAVAMDAPIALLSEARCLWRLENSLQIALSTDDLDGLRRVVEEVEYGKVLASFPREPPYALKQQLQYWSEKKETWIDCYVTEVSEEGKIQINLKKKAGHWCSLHEQGRKFRVADAELSAVAALVWVDDAQDLLDKADALQAALRSGDIARINAAITQAGRNNALQSLVSRADAFVRDHLRSRMRNHTEVEVDWRSPVAAAWHAAKKTIRQAMQAEADRACEEAGGQGWGNLEKDLVIEKLTGIYYLGIE